MAEVSRWQVREAQALLAYAREVEKLPLNGYRMRMRRLAGATTAGQLRHAVTGLPQPSFLQAATAPVSEADRGYVRALTRADDRGAREGGWWLAGAIAEAGNGRELRAVLTAFLEGQAPQPGMYPLLEVALLRRKLWQRAWHARSTNDLAKEDYQGISAWIEKGADAGELAACADQPWTAIMAAAGVTPSPPRPGRKSPRGKPRDAWFSTARETPPPPAPPPAAAPAVAGAPLDAGPLHRA